MSLSFGAIIGQFLEPIFRPLGFGHWQLIVALVSGIAAKEVVVSEPIEPDISDDIEGSI